MTAAPGRTLADADPVGIALWTLFGAALLAASFGDRLSTGWSLIFWACWVGQAVWWAVRRYAPGEPRTVLDIMGNVIHNGAMLVIVAEVCLIYSTMRLVQDPGQPLAGRHRALLPAASGRLHPW